VRLSQPQQRARQQIEELAARPLGPAELGGRIMQALGIALPNDGYRLFGIDPVTLLVNRLLAASDDDAWARDEWLREVYLAAEPLTYIELPNLMRLGLHAAAVHELQAESWGFPQPVLGQLTDREHYLAFHELRSPVGGTLFGCFHAAGRWVAAAQLYRRERAHPFLRTDVAFLRLVAPIIGQALAAGFVREHALPDALDQDATAAGVLILEPNGKVDLSNPAGGTWLQLLQAADRNGALPTALWAAIASARSSGTGAGALIAPTSAGAVRIEASAIGPHAKISVVVVPQQPPAGPTIPADWQLTPQEERVVMQVLNGLSNREIAATLVVSENTVQTHLSHIYDKLGVRGRSQLLSRFFRESFLTDIGG
jgi:DNA-binding CsgD family transcriptional regulator